MEYLSIGKVSKLKNVSIKSLRYYDAIGILKPAYINVNTNYRYYTKEQLYLLDVIRLCVSLGIPLKNIQNYVKEDSLDLQKLLYDSKMIARQRIRDIQTELEALQNTLSKLSVSASGTTPFVSAKTGTVCPTRSHTHQPVITVPLRTILLVPMDEHTTPKYYGQYILKLFVLAQQYGLSAHYPSGVLYECQNGDLKQYMFLHIDPVESVPEALSGFIRFLPGAECQYQYLKTHLETDAADCFPDCLDSAKDYTILEVDILDTTLKDKGYFYELLLYPETYPEK